MSNTTYFYICDGKACANGCAPGSQCKHTHDPKHAKYSEHDWDNADVIFNGELIFEKEKEE